MTPNSLTLPAYFANGQPYRQSIDIVDLHDRGLAYGDGVFETMLACDGRIPFWRYHHRRLLKGVEHLGITLDDEIFEKHCHSVFEALKNIPQACVVKLIITRGNSARGYAPGDTKANIFTSIGVLSQNTLDQTGCSVHLCKEILAEPVSWAGLKTLNQLSYVLASKERIHTAFDEGLMCTSQGHVIEATARNFFCVKDNCLLTPDLASVGVAGVMRDIILEQFVPKLKLNSEVRPLALDELFTADEIFLCNSVTGIWPVTEISDTYGSRIQHWPVGQTTLKIQHLLKDLRSKSS